MKWRVLIVDDEAPARALLGSLLAELGNTTLASEAATGEEALRLAVETSPDIVLLDIRMPGIGGLETARQLNSLVEPPAIIFTTAYDEYAIHAFESQAAGYLLKPIRKEKLAEALNRAVRLTRPQLQQLATQTSEAAPPRTHIAIRHREGLRLVALEEIRCFLADSKYTTVCHLKGEDLIEDSLRSLEEEFGNRLVRIHRSALINIQYLETIERSAEGQYCVRLRGATEPLPVSRRMAGDLKERFRV
jgi:two-component system, LytTR family, response regulator AlgR